MPCTLLDKQKLFNGLIMCGIAGIYAFNDIGKFYMVNFVNATQSISSRGPDNQGLFANETIALGHRRLSIIDKTAAANQPMQDETARYRIVFNGEIYNYQSIRAELESKGIEFQTHSDTEVLLKLFINEGEKCLSKLNGFFSFAIYDSQTESIFLARDPLGIKPLYYYFDEDKFIFGSELKVFHAFKIDTKIDFTSLHYYFQLSYIPAPNSVLEGVKKLEAGCFLTIKKKSITEKRYYYLKKSTGNLKHTEKKEKLKRLLENSVQKRLVSDVPLGAFLSGGIDSSIIVALASQFKENLQTYSIGFSDNSFFDETKYAELVAEKYQTKHTTFELSNEDLYHHIFDFLDSLDEPFADSSALPLYILSKKVSKEVKVALSGDGADELFAGYNKYKAENKIYNPGIKESLVSAFYPLLQLLPQSRNSKVTNLFRQLNRFAEGSKMNAKDRYWRWCSYLTSKESHELLLNNNLEASNLRRERLLNHLEVDNKDINNVLLSDVNLVLQNDMLTKVDRMSMAHGLEVRVPFLDPEVVQFAFSLPQEDKISGGVTKKILKESFEKELPIELLKRPKHGFEVPLLDWLKNDLWNLLDKDLLSQSFIQEQGVFEWEKILYFKKKLHSRNPEDTHATIWSLLVFQWWFKKTYLSN